MNHVKIAAADRMHNERRRYRRHGGHGRVGLGQRLAKRLAIIRTEITTSELIRALYPRGNGHLWNAKQSAERYWQRVELVLREGRWQWLWRPK